MKKILMIEDYPIIQDIYKKQLDKKFEVKIAADGDKALELVADETFDFVLLDMLLPNINGEEFLSRFSKMENFSKSIVIVLSDFDYPNTVKRAYDLGAKEYWLKIDNNPRTLLEKLENYDD